MASNRRVRTATRVSSTPWSSSFARVTTGTPAAGRAETASRLRAKPLRGIHPASARASELEDLGSSIVDRPSSIVGQRPGRGAPAAGATPSRPAECGRPRPSSAGGAARTIRIVRDARWLIQTAQSPLTRHVTPYFIKAGQRVGIVDDARLEIHKAGAVLAGGHLRSQLRHLSWRTGWAFDDPRLLALTRSSNSMDMALLVHDLVPLLDAYSAACVRQDSHKRLALADAILQGLSADPELLMTRLDLLGPSTMIEELFVDRRHAGSAFALRRISLRRTRRWAIQRWARCIANVSRGTASLMGRTAESLQQDSVHSIQRMPPTRRSASSMGSARISFQTWS